MVFSVLFLWPAAIQAGRIMQKNWMLFLPVHNDTYEFGTKTTYAMPDKIVKITGNLEEGEAPAFVPDRNGCADTE